jgi:predicted nucleotide-binding protein
VHGRNVKAADELRRFLRALGLRPLEWNQAVAKTRQGAPYVGTILEKAFEAAAAVVVLMTPDDEARLRAPYRRAGDPVHEARLTGQARANVLFEAGMAFGKNANSTVIVQLGRVRPFSDVAGRHVVNLDNSGPRRRELATRLANAGCDVDISGYDWLTEGDFSLNERRGRRGRGRRRG